MSEVADFMRGLSFFPSDYEIECLQHELQLCGQRKISFEELVKLYLNHSHSSSNGTDSLALQNSLRNLFETARDSSSVDININKLELISALTESGEKIEEKDAEMYLNELFRNRDNKFINEISLSDFMHHLTTLSLNKRCLASS